MQRPEINLGHCHNHGEKLPSEQGWYLFIFMLCMNTAGGHCKIHGCPGELQPEIQNQGWQWHRYSQETPSEKAPGT